MNDLLIEEAAQGKAEGSFSIFESNWLEVSSGQNQALFNNKAGTKIGSMLKAQKRKVLKICSGLFYEPEPHMR